MGIGTSIFLIAVGAILKYAVDADVSGVDINTVGTILLIIGILGLVISLLYTIIWSDRVRRDRAVDDYPPPRDRYGPRY
jgi:beta-lactamase regulating signal transducer with metallopeptidase domain